MFNEGMDQMTASFGTAQQQQSKQQALRHGGGVGGSLADLATIQGMQDQTIKDNERARFMGNAAVFAQTLSSLYLSRLQRLCCFGAAVRV
jgi:hypothetical protein